MQTPSEFGRMISQQGTQPKLAPNYVAGSVGGRAITPRPHTTRTVTRTAVVAPKAPAAPAIPDTATKKA